jgi:hypothetical protein
MKRFQECSWYVKLWRYRFYLTIPFEWSWVTILTTLGIRNYDPMFKGKFLWRLLKSIAQCHMNWTYTTEEVFGKLKTKRR